jgi:uncharacterized protein
MNGRRIAVVGGGVSGLTAAYVLSRGSDVTLFEASGRLGGHADTHQVTAADGTEIAIDTGFIVHNKRTYPLLTRLFDELGVATRESEMSMSVRCAGCGLEYAGQRGLGGLAAGVRRGGGRYLRMLTEIRRFHRSARRLLRDGGAGDGGAGDRDGAGAGGGPTLSEFLAADGYSRYFVTHFAMPFVAAVWSCSPGTALAYPARYLFAFLDQHGLLSVTGSPPWLTVEGGSRNYVELVAKQLTSVRADTPVTAVRRLPGGVEVSHGARQNYRAGQAAERFDAVVIATHPDQALRLLADPTAAEREILGTFRYSHNATVLHTDSRVLPASPRVRASWNYILSSCAAAGDQVQVSYYMNRLQRLTARQDYIVTLNGAGLGGSEPGVGQVLARMDYAHPIYDPASVAAQRRLPELNDGITAYAGAYHGWGFHEDGCRSGVAAARSLGVRW